MNKYEKRAQAERNSALRSSISLGGIGLAVLIVGVLVFWLHAQHGPVSYSGKIAVGLALALLLLRIVGRVMKSWLPKAAQPDPKSVIKLD